ncbi:MAG: ATP-binding protein [Lachnospiraceae bacterium]
MLKHLKRNIILVNMLLVGSVFVGILILNGFRSIKSEKESLMNSLSQTIMQEVGFKNMVQQNKNNERIFEGKKNQKPEDLFLVQYYSIITVNTEGKQIEDTISTMKFDETLVNTVIKRALSNPKNSEILWKDSIIYMKFSMPNNQGIHIILSEISHLRNSIISTIASSTAIGIAALTILFVISTCLSNYAIKPVEKAWEQQKQFIADASHELKTPLTVILANYNIIMSHPTETVQSQMKWLESSQEVAEHMKYLVNQMLFLAKSDANRTLVVKSTVNFSEVVEEVILHFDPVAYEKGVFLSYENHRANILLQSDRSLLIQLLHILLDNAVKYSEPNTQIDITLNQCGDKIIFSVTNTGHGISKEELPHIFERFYRTDKARTEGGYGLGLAIADSITRQLQGKIHVISEGNQTTFTLEF